MVPTDELPPMIPLTSQWMTLSTEPVTDAVNCWLSPRYMWTSDGEMVTSMTRTVAVPDFVVSPLATALMDTGLVAGGCAGEQKRPVESIVPIAALPPAISLTYHWTE